MKLKVYQGPFIWLFALLYFTGFQSFAAEVAPAVKTSTITPLFWQLEHKGVKSYALGSVHLGKPSMYPLPEPIMAGFKATETLVVEVDPGQENHALMRELVDEFGKDKKRDILSWLSKPTQHKYQAYCQKLSIPCHLFGNYRPWLVSVTLASHSFMRSGFDAKLGIDQYFLAQANNKKPVIELETLESQFALFAGMSAALQEEMLLQSMTEDSEDFINLVNMWSKGDEKGMIKMFSEVKDPALKTLFVEKMLIERNHGMAGGLLGELKRGKTLFVVVGTAHLIGEQNVLSLLQKGGIKVTRIDLK
ncbi:MAG: hypothetical protein ACI8WB_001534 [Phenylobacterium sp.]|jgi:uncharacterized protein YbaP (TraB family)